MISFIKLKYISLIVTGLMVILISVFVFVDIDKPIDNHYGLKLGMSKFEVIDMLRKQGVSQIMPDIDSIVVKSPNLLTSKLNNASAICVGDNSGFTFQVSFNAYGISEKVKNSVPANPDEWGIYRNKSREYILERVKHIMLARSNVTASSCIMDIEPIEITAVDAADISNINRFNYWTVYIPNTNIRGVIHFSQDKISKIEFRELNK